jgi:hypothetical protein
MGMMTRGAAFTVVPNTTGIVGAPIDDAQQIGDVPACNPEFANCIEAQKVSIEVSRERGVYPSSLTIKKGIPVDVKADSGSRINIEITNRSGRPGWLYGKAQFIALHDEAARGFALIDLPALRDLVHKKGRFTVDRWGNIDGDLKMVDRPQEADLFRGLFYQRRAKFGELQPSIMTAIDKSKLQPFVKGVLQ